MKKLWFVVVVVVLFCGLFNVRADDYVTEKDRVAAEHYQKQLDAEEKVAHDKAERDWEREHSGGGDLTSLFGPFFLLVIIGGAIAYCKFSK